MTQEEAGLKRIEFLKIDIRNRLHKYNPSKYPKVKSYTVREAFDVEFTLMIPKLKNIFDRDDYFYKQINKK